MTRLPTRRAVLAAGVATLLVRPAMATPEERLEAIRDFAGEAEIRTGKVRLDLPPLVENGNAAPLTISVDGPLDETNYVRRIAVFNEKNPLPHVITAHLGPRAGHATLSTRIRLATTQRITGIAEMSDGTFWQDTADVIVTLAACVEG